MSASETFIAAGKPAASGSVALSVSRNGLVNLADVPVAAWAALAARAQDANVFYDPAWARAAARTARVIHDPKAILAYDSGDGSRLIGMLPVVPAWRAYRLPIPVLVAWQGYAPLTTPLLDGEFTALAAERLIDAAKATGAHALVLPFCIEDSATFQAIEEALHARGLAPEILRRHARAAFDATADAEAELRAALGKKKLKELGRQSRRLEDSGPVTFDVVNTPDAVAAALESFLALESAGWKGQRGTSLGQNPGDTAFIRTAARELAAQGRCEIAMLRRNDHVLATGLLLRHGTRVFFFKLAYDESEAKNSPGVQLTLEITRHLAADARVRDVDSTADAEHPMIDHIWRGRLPVAEIFIPTGLSHAGAAVCRRLIQTRAALREPARRLIHALRALKGKRP
jgi:CelD/BcsL family acetyltransferase involved in cellulose biosynthesis